MNDLLLFVDTETTGLPPRWDMPEDDRRWPRLVQVAAILATQEGREVATFATVIKPNFEIPIEASNVHGISTEYAVKNGMGLFYAMQTLSLMAMKASTFVAHNVAFDIAIIRSEIARLDKADRFKPLKRFCTMKESVDICRLAGRYPGKYKFPKLQELHQYYFGAGFEDGHDALIDVRACLKCYIQMTKPQELFEASADDKKPQEQNEKLQWL